jgi:chromosome segregation ATPase
MNNPTQDNLQKLEEQQRLKLIEHYEEIDRLQKLHEKKIAEKNSEILELCRTLDNRRRELMDVKQRAENAEHNFSVEHDLVKKRDEEIAEKDAEIERLNKAVVHHCDIATKFSGKYEDSKLLLAEVEKDVAEAKQILFHWDVEEEYELYKGESGDDLVCSAQDKIVEAFNKLNKIKSIKDGGVE